MMTVLRQSTLRVAGVGLTWLYTVYRRAGGRPLHGHTFYERSA